MTENYPDTHYGLKNSKDAQDVIGWTRHRCIADPAAIYPVKVLYECYCKDAGRAAWPLAGAISVSLFSRALAEAGIERRKASVTVAVGLRPKSLLPKQDDTI